MIDKNLFIVTATPSRRESKRRWIDENVKCESEMKTKWKLLKEVRFKNRLKTDMLCLWHLVVKRTNCCTELSQCRQQDNVSG